MSATTSSGDQPLDRIFLVLESVLAAGNPITISEIAERVGLPTPTVHRLTAQLNNRGMLKRAIGSKRVLPGPRLVALGAQILEAAMLMDRPHASLQRLANEIGEHCQIGVVVDGEVHYVDTARVDQPSGLRFQPGRQAPLHCTSIGKLFLACLPDAELGRWLDGAHLHTYTDNTMVDRIQLGKSIRKIRKSGWAWNNEEYVAGVVGCAVPIRTSRGGFLAGLGLAAPASRLSFNKCEKLIPRLNMAADDVAKALD
jgi:DNA-binding IclR family transcriptional regulator